MSLRKNFAVAGVFGMLWSAAAAGQTPPPASPMADAATTLTLPPVEVIATTPLLGSGVDRDKVPAATTTLDSSDISRGGNPSFLNALSELAPGVTLDDAASNPYQPSIFYHGFQASPLQGNSQGMAVYLNGARFNQPFGDTVNWDLIPDIAIDRMNLEGSNPVFGLNALGGALAVQMKNGFTYHGTEVDLLGGSFGHYEGQFQYGVQSGNVAAYVAARGLHQDGWRFPQSSNLGNFFGDIGWRGERGEFHIDVTQAQTRLDGPGSSPIEQIQADPSATFTGPALLTNHYTRVNMTGNFNLSDETSIQTDAYYDYLMQKYANGAVPDISPCDDGSGNLCAAPGVFATGLNGAPIPDFLNGGPYNQLNLQSTGTNGYGGSVQITNRTPIFGHGNHFVAGASFDGAHSLYSASSEIGGLYVPISIFFGPGITIDQADGSIAPARVDIVNAYYGTYFTDTFDITPTLAANIAGRFNLAKVDLSDQLGTALTGNHDYSRFNPSAGLTWKIRPGLTVYGSYAEANRAPMPVELTCASAAAPCSLANFLVADPDLQQVVSHTFEAGVRMQSHPFADATLNSELSFYRTNLNNDILAVGSSLPGLSFFQNVGGTLRQGFDLSFKLKYRRLSAYLGYSFIDATFQTPFTAQSPSNPAADVDGNIFVKSGDHLPGIPQNILKFGADYSITDAWTVGGSALYESGQYLFGDEANLTPTTPPYFVLGLRTAYQVTKNFQVFAKIDNAFNAQYYTFGTFGPTSAVPIAQAPGATNPRSYSPAAPISALVGLRITF